MKSLPLRISAFALLMMFLVTGATSSTISAKKKSAPKLLIPTDAQEEIAVVKAFAKDLSKRFEDYQKEKNAKPLVTTWEESRFSVKSMDEDSVVLTYLDGEKAGQEESFDWRLSFPSLFDRLRMLLGSNDPQHKVAIAAMSFDFSSPFCAGRLLYQVEQEVESRKDDIRAFYARRTFEEPANIVEYGGCLITSDQRDEAEKYKSEIRTFKAAFSKIASAKKPEEQEAARKEAMKIVQTFASMEGNCARLALVDHLIEERDQALKTASRHAKRLSGSKVNKPLHELLQQRRKHALSLIHNEKIWPYPYGPRDEEVREEVRKRLREVELIWHSPEYGALEADKKTGPEVRVVRDCHTFFELLDPQKHMISSTFLDDLQPLVNGKVSADDFQKYAIKADKLNKWYDEVMAFNTEAQKASKDKSECPTEDAWAQLNVTNEFRCMIGLHLVKMNYKLFWAAQHHAQWCVEKNNNEIDHDSPGGPRGNNPQQRVKHEGYFASGVSENLSLGRETPTEVLWGWLMSSGHSRNVCDPGHRVLGVGHFGEIWCQVYSSTDEKDGNTVSRGGK